MDVHKKLGGANPVQMSHMNRPQPGKQRTTVLDSANEADEIRKAFELYHETTLLSEEADPNLPYEAQGRLLNFGVFPQSRPPRPDHHSQVYRTHTLRHPDSWATDSNSEIAWPKCEVLLDPGRRIITCPPGARTRAVSLMDE